MICEVCWSEFQRLDAAVRALRFDATLKPQLPIRHIVSLLGLSSRVSRAFGGHHVFVGALAVLFGLEWTVGIWSELGYSYERFGALAWTLSLPVGVASAAGLLIAAWLDTRVVRAGRSHGLLLSIAAVLVVWGILTGALMLVLPAEPTIRASFQTRTAAGGFLKDVLFIFLPLLVFVLPSFDAVLRFQQEITAADSNMSRTFSKGVRNRVLPRGVVYLTPRVLAFVLLVLGTIKLVGANHMLDALTPGPYAHLFTVASYVSTGVWLAIAITAISWYAITLNELNRESQMLTRLDRHESEAQ